MVVMGDFFGGLAGWMRVAFCRGGYGALLAFSMSVFARWFAVHPVQAFVWLHAHRLPRLRLRSPPRDASGCARVGAYGCRGLARGRAPADSGRFRRKWAPISPWVLDFCAVFGGSCSPSALPTWENAGILWRFGLIRLAKPPKSCEWGLRVARGARRLLQGTPVAKAGIRA